MTDLEDSVTRLETNMEGVQKDIREMRSDLRTLLQVTIGMWATTMLALVAMFVTMMLTILART